MLKLNKISHLLSFSIGLLLIISVYLFLRRSFTVNISLFTTLLFSLNRLFIHYTPFTMTDIPASFLCLLSIFLYLKAREMDSLLLYGCLTLSITFQGLGIVWSPRIILLFLKKLLFRTISS